MSIPSSVPIVAAMEYAAMGWKIFPLSPGSKQPLKDTRGFLDATSDFATIARWFGESPNANLAVATGEASGIWILDVDKDHDGLDSIQKLCDRLGHDILVTRTHQTRAGGLHFIYAWPEDDDGPLPRKINLFKHDGLPGLDLLGNDGYAVLPPSIVSPGSYKLVDSEPVQRAPGALLGAVRTALAGPVHVQGPRVTGEVRGAVKGPAGMLGWLANVQPGGQDDACSWVARALRDEGVNAAEAADLLWTAVSQMATNGRPWTENDVRRHINSAYRGTT